MVVYVVIRGTIYINILNYKLVLTIMTNVLFVSSQHFVSTYLGPTQFPLFSFIFKLIAPPNVLGTLKIKAIFHTQVDYSYHKNR